MSDHPPSRQTLRRPPPADGSSTIVLIDEQAADRRRPVDARRWERLAERVLSAAGAPAGAELSVVYVDEPAMAELNERFTGTSAATDVLAFPLDDVETAPGPGSEVPVLVGDVVICPAVAERNAPDHAGSYDDELALLLVHGVLHLLGHDHANDEERAEMQARERDLLERFHGALAADPWRAP